MENTYSKYNYPIYHSVRAAKIPQHVRVSSYLGGKHGVPVKNLQVVPETLQMEKMHLEVDDDAGSVCVYEEQAGGVAGVVPAEV